MKTFEVTPFNRPNNALKVFFDNEDAYVSVEIGTNREVLRLHPEQLKEFLEKVLKELKYTTFI